MRAEYGDNNFNFLARAKEASSVTGLTAFDERVLSQAAGLISPPHLSELSRLFSERN
jgi:hypothetical protein